MPIVPVEENGVGLAGLTDAKLRAADYSGSGLEALGAGLAGLGKAGAEFAESLPRADDPAAAHARLLRTDLAAKQAWNDGHSANAAILDDFRQLNGKDARAALAPAAEAMMNNFHAVRHGLGDDDHARAIIDDTLAHRTAKDIADLHAHADAQDRIAQAQESERLIDNSATDALRHPDDPARFDAAITTGENSLRRQGQLAGKPEAAIADEVARWRSSRYVEAAHALAPHDGLGATALFERYHAQLTPADRADLAGLLQEPMAQAQAIADIDTPALAAAPYAPLTPQDDPLLADRMRTITPHLDRVMLPELMQRYDGDAARAWAATQIGADAVDDLIKQHGDGWYRALPEQARNAVAHNFALLMANGSPRTAPQDPGAVTASLTGLDEARRSYAERELTLRTTRADQARRTAQGAAADQAYELADQLGHDFTSLAQLPPKLRADLSEQTSTALQRQADANIDPRPVAPQGAVALALHDMAATAPDAFRNTDLREYRPLVSPDEYAMFVRLQNGIQARDEAKTKQSLGVRSLGAADGTPFSGAGPMFPNSVRSNGFGMRPIASTQQGAAGVADSTQSPAAPQTPSPLGLPAAAQSASQTTAAPLPPASATTGSGSPTGQVQAANANTPQPPPLLVPLTTATIGQERVLAARISATDAARLSGENVIATPAMRAAAQAQIRKVRVATGDDEILAFGYLMPDGTIDVRPGGTAGSGRNSDNAHGKPAGPGKLLFVIHGHIESRNDGSDGDDGMVDAPDDPASGGRGDADGLFKYHVPVATVYGNHIGWRELRNGQLTFSVPLRSQSPSQLSALEARLTREQPQFLKPVALH